jgi:DNA primase
LKAKLQLPNAISNWSEIEGLAFTHPAYRQLRETIDSHGDIAANIDRVADERMRALTAELMVEPVRTDGEVSTRYIESIVARLREVAISQRIADVKSTLQRINPLENESEYNALFGDLVALESTRRTLHDLALGEI